ncbi:MAG: RnfABCDGE type electron transport complex subunit D [Bacillota bacterium]
MSAKKLVTVSPYVASNNKSQTIMRDVLIALVPACIMSIFLFGMYSLFIIMLSVATCVASELAYCKIINKKATVCDLSACVTGVILALNLPPYVAFYVPIIGGVFAIMVVKMLFGGLGRNFANPAAAARVFLLISLSGAMTTYYAPVSINSLSALFYFPSADAIATATPLADVVSLNQVFLGNVAGSIGETSALALLIGGIYLIARKVIDVTIPAVIIGVVFAFTIALGGSFTDGLYAICAGGLMLGAFFMATDYSTSPNTRKGQMIYAFIIALVTVLVRNFGAYPEGMSLAILFANLFVPMIDKFITPKRFGGGVDKAEIAIFAVIKIFCVVMFVIAIVRMVA